MATACSDDFNFSQFVSDTLDSMGYNPAIVKHRQHTWKYHAATLERSLDGDFACIYAGSKGEGVTAFWESDIDVIFVFNDVICTDSPELGFSQQMMLPNTTSSNLHPANMSKLNTTPGKFNPMSGIKNTRFEKLDPTTGIFQQTPANINAFPGKLNMAPGKVHQTPGNGNKPFGTSIGSIHQSPGNLNQRFVRKMTFRFERELSPPGYTLLKLEYLPTAVGNTCTNSSYRILLSSLFKTDSGTRYISSDIFHSYMTLNRPLPGSLPRQGPSAPSKALGISQDLVYAFRCHCPGILKAWLSRPRCQDWPSPSMIKKVSALDAHVVPVGYNLSREQHLEWRICFTLAEIELIHSFNDTQTKVYVMLKAIAKSVLKPISDSITSYVMKNLILWVCELTDTHLFRNDLLIERLVQSLLLLSKFIERKNVPNYMISERNLIYEKLDKKQQLDLLSAIRELVLDGGKMLRRCVGIRSGLLKMYKAPEQARQKAEEEDLQERRCLLQSDTPRQKILKPSIPISGLLHPLQVRQGPIFNSLGTKVTDASDAQMDQLEDETKAMVIDPAEQELWRLGKHVGNRRLPWKMQQIREKKEN